MFIEYDNRALFGKSQFDPERWREYVRLGKNHVAASVLTCPYKAVPFGAGPRRCAGQNLARSVLKRTLRWALREFPVRKQTDHLNVSQGVGTELGPLGTHLGPLGTTRSWDRFQPGSGHKYSGRNNDENDQDTNMPYMALRLLQILGRSIVIGLKRRLGVDNVSAPQTSSIMHQISNVGGKISFKSKDTVPRVG